MKSRKMILSLGFIIVFLLSILSTTFSINAEIIEGVDDYNTVWRLDTETGTISFSGNASISKSGEWNKYKHSIKKVIIGPDIKKINEQAFFYYSNLSEVEIPNTLTDIGLLAFTNTPFYNSLPR